MATEQIIESINKSLSDLKTKIDLETEKINKDHNDAVEAANLKKLEQEEKIKGDKEEYKKLQIALAALTGEVLTTPEKNSNNIKGERKNIPDMQGKIQRSIKKIGKDAYDVKLSELVSSLQQLFPEFNFISNNVNSSFNTYKKKLKSNN